jgi:regulator of sirC expression with transglutaminase-like and TPR domain
MKNSELKALVSLLDDEDAEVLEHVEQKIISLGNTVIPFLEEEWEKSFSPLVQKKIEDLIHHLQIDNLRSRIGEWRENRSQDLLEGMWMIATYQYPDLSLERLRKELDQIYYEAWIDFRGNMHPLDQIKIINNILFNKLKFGANTKNFHSPGNSMLNVVLESRRGNPISLCVIYMLIAQKLKLPVYGVNLPNLFILTYKTPETQFYINVFNKGIVFSRTDIDSYLSQLNLPHSDMFYEPCQPIDIIRRVLRNLIESFKRMGETDKEQEIRLLLNTISDSEDENQVIE